MRIIILHMTMGITSRGSEVVVDRLACELVKTNEVMVIQSGAISVKPYQVKRVMPLDKAPIPSPTNILSKITFRLHLDNESKVVAKFTQASLPEIKKYKPDIIIAINGPLQIKILKQFRLSAKLVAFGHAGIGYHDKHTIQAKPDLFVALSPQAEAWARELAYYQTKVVYIPNPIDSSKNKQPMKLKLPRPIVLTVSALSKYKNVHNVIEAIHQTGYSYLLIGDGEEADRIAKILSKLPSDFKWIKQVNGLEIEGYYKSADIFCFTPNAQEAFGMVYLEAMSAGLPIVASNDPIRRELIGKKGVYVDPGDSSSIAKGLNVAAKLKKLSYTQELQPYRLSTVVTQIEGAFHEIIS